VQIAFLAERLQAIPCLAAWFIAEWPDYYGRRSTLEVENDFRECLNTARLPIGLVAYDHDTPCGVIVLRESAMTDLPQYSPGLGAFYVAGSHRNRGIGAQLLRMGVSVAKKLGHRAVYATTSRAGRIFERAGWQDLGTVLHRGQALSLYRWQRVSDPAGEHFGAARGLRL
jgi:GNAT superfamily N-acetyltransferase